MIKNQKLGKMSMKSSRESQKAQQNANNRQQQRQILLKTINQANVGKRTKTKCQKGKLSVIFAKRNLHGPGFWKII